MTDSAKMPMLLKPSRLADYVDVFACNSPEAEAVVFGTERISYLELLRRVDEFAKALLAYGAGRGTRVAMMCAPRSEFWICFLATVRIGAIWVGLNPRYTPAEIGYVLQDIDPRIVFSIRETGGRELSVGAGEGAAEPEQPEFISITGDWEGATAYKDFLARSSQTSEQEYRAACACVEPDDAALIVYTSGSSGSPKGAVLSHHSLCFGAEMQASHFNVSMPSCVVNFPINHVACVADACATTLVRGGKIVFHEAFDPTRMLQGIADERCSIWGGVPAMFLLQMQETSLADFDLSSVELVIWGGAAMPRDAISTLSSLGARLMTTYGMTETACNTTFTGENCDISCLAETVGKPDPAYPCRIVDDAGKLCEADEPGELQFEGSHLMQEYWNRPEASRIAFTEDGWLKTGDIGHWRADGNIVLVGRATEMFKSGGYNIYPREIEIVIENHASIALAAVVGVEDPVFQEVGHAFVVPVSGERVDESEIREWCKKFLANYKVPKRFHIMQVLPMLPVGKIDKQALKRQVEKWVPKEKL